MMKPLFNRRFYSRLSYSFGNEDPNVERKALTIQPNDRVLCITASGDRPLHLLLDECAEVVAIDLNETQNNLLALKVKAMEKFDFDRYLAFLGASESGYRLTELKLLLPYLDKSSYETWTHHKRLIHEGVLYQGAMEKLCRKLAFGLRVLRGKKIKKLFEFDDLQRQQAFVNHKWNTFAWKKSLDIALNSHLLRFILKDPGLFAQLGDRTTPGAYIFQRVTHSLNTRLANESILLSLILRGFVDPKGFPCYLQENGVKTIKPRLHKLSWKTANIIEFLENSPPNSFDCFSLSDIPSYMDKDNFHRLLSAVRHAATPKARFSMRQFMSDHVIPEPLRSSFQRNPSLESTLEAEDCCFVYRFMVGTIDK